MNNLNSLSHEEERRQQAAEAARLARQEDGGQRANRQGVGSWLPEQRPHRQPQHDASKVKPHMTFLEQLKNSRAFVRFEFDSSDESLEAVIAHHDEDTISVFKPEGGTRVIFKSALRSFEPTGRRLPPKEEKVA